MDPAQLSNWTALAIGVGGSLITGAIWYGALRVWMARREWKEQAVEVELAKVQLVQGDHARALGNHGERIRVLENEMDLRPPPMDYAAR